MCPSEGRFRQFRLRTSGWMQGSSSCWRTQDFLDDDLEGLNDALSPSHVNHELEHLLLVGLSWKDQCSVVLMQVFVLELRNHPAWEKKIGCYLDLPSVDIGSRMIIQVMVAIAIIPDHLGGWSWRVFLWFLLLWRVLLWRSIFFHLGSNGRMLLLLSDIPWRMSRTVLLCRLTFFLPLSSLPLSVLIILCLVHYG